MTLVIGSGNVFSYWLIVISYWASMTCFSYMKLDIGYWVIWLVFIQC